MYLGWVTLKTVDNNNKDDDQKIKTIINSAGLYFLKKKSSKEGRRDSKMSFLRFLAITLMVQQQCGFYITLWLYVSCITCLCLECVLNNLNYLYMS